MDACYTFYAMDAPLPNSSCRPCAGYPRPWFRSEYVDEDTSEIDDPPCPHSDLSTFQNTGVAGPSSTPERDFLQALGALYCPSGR
jgi:hypothetical protein